MSKPKYFRLRSKFVLMVILTLATFAWFVFMTLSVIDESNELKNIERLANDDQNIQGTEAGPFYENPNGHLIPKPLPDMEADNFSNDRKWQNRETNGGGDESDKNDDGDEINANVDPGLNEEEVEDDAVVRDDAVVNDDVVGDDAEVNDEAVVEDEAEVKNDVLVNVVRKDSVVGDDDVVKEGEGSVEKDDGVVGGDVVVKDDEIFNDGAELNDHDVYEEDAIGNDDAVIRDDSAVEDEDVVEDDAEVKDDAVVREDSVVNDDAEVNDEDVHNEDAVVNEDALVRDGPLVKNDVAVEDNAEVKDDVVDKEDVEVEHDAVVKDDWVKEDTLGRNGSIAPNNKQDDESGKVRKDRPSDEKAENGKVIEALHEDESQIERGRKEFVNDEIEAAKASENSKNAESRHDKGGEDLNNGAKPGDDSAVEDLIEKEKVLDDIHDGDEAQKEPEIENILEDDKEQRNKISDDTLDHDKPQNDKALDEIVENDREQHDKAFDDLPDGQTQKIQNDSEPHMPPGAIKPIKMMPREIKSVQRFKVKLQNDEENKDEGHKEDKLGIPSVDKELENVPEVDRNLQEVKEHFDKDFKNHASKETTENDLSDKDIFQRNWDKSNLTEGVNGRLANDQVAEKVLRDKNGPFKRNGGIYNFKKALQKKVSKDVISEQINTTSLLWNDWPIDLLPYLPDNDIVRKLTNNTNPGDGGVKFVLDKYDLPRLEQKKLDKGRLMHGMNEYVSNIIGLRRTLTDTRLKGCAERYPASNDLPQTSIIICFVNEAWSTLLRTVHSVLDNSPAHLVKEIILVDDGSTWDFLGKPLEEYMSRYRKVKILRTSGIGLMKARMLGYNHTTAPTVTFLDSHIECAKGWLEPLLHPLTDNPMIVVTPVIASIDKTTFEFSTVGDVQVGVISFPYLYFTWRCQPPREVLRRKDDPIGNVRNPAMAGGLFIITRKFFDSLGRFDPAMKAWGGENIEMSLKTWMCGGRIETSPCSVVGHVFHSHVSYTKLRPQGGTDYRTNLVRTSHVWMREDAAKYYSDYNSDKYLIGDASERIEIRDRLQCKDFKWYIENINPEAALPGEGMYSGQITSLSNTSVCLGTQRIAKTLEAQPCNIQVFDMTDLGEVVIKGRCLQRKGSLLVFEQCNWLTETFFWKYEDMQIKGDNHECLKLTTTNEIVLEKCDGKTSQKWKWEYRRPRRKNVLLVEDVRNLRH